MNPKKILLSIPLASLLILTPNVSAGPTLSEYENTQHHDPELAPLNSASTVEEERAMFRELVAEQNHESIPEQNPDAIPSSWWSEFSRFLNSADIQHLADSTGGVSRGVD